MRLHDLAMADEYFTSRRLAPNVDFWRCAAVGLCVCTPVANVASAAVSSTVPWVSQWTVRVSIFVLSDERRVADVWTLLLLLRSLPCALCGSQNRRVAWTLASGTYITTAAANAKRDPYGLGAWFCR